LPGRSLDSQEQQPDICGVEGWPSPNNSASVALTLWTDVPIVRAARYLDVDKARASAECLTEERG
jgi:hypothetical protein